MVRLKVADVDVGFGGVVALRGVELGNHPTRRASGTGVRTQYHQPAWRNDLTAADEASRKP